jgi:hypothetical protein
MCWLDVLAESGVTTVTCRAKAIAVNRRTAPTTASSVCA